MNHGLLPENRKHLKNVRKFLRHSNLALHVGSVAAAVEALESILIEKGILKDDELMTRVRAVMQQHYEKGELISPSED